MESLIIPPLKQFIDTLPNFCVAKDLQSNYLYANQHYAELVGLRRNEEAVGMTDLDLPCAAVESAQLFRAQDHEVILTGQPLRILDIHRYAGNQWRSLLFTKTPLRDPQQNIVGTISHGQELYSRELLELEVQLGKIANRPKDCAELFTSSSHTIARPSQGPKLTQRQEAILFLLLRGRSARLIGMALGITIRTVEWHQRMLKDKFAVLSKSELVDKAIELGYLHHLPPGLSKRSLSIILRED